MLNLVNENKVENILKCLQSNSSRFFVIDRLSKTTPSGIHFPALHALSDFLPAHYTRQFAFFLASYEGIDFLSNDGSYQIAQLQPITIILVNRWQFNMPIGKERTFLTKYLPINQNIN